MGDSYKVQFERLKKTTDKEREDREKLISDLMKKASAMTVELESYRNGTAVIATPEDVQMKVVELRAKNLSLDEIIKNLELLGIEVEEKNVKNIILVLDSDINGGTNVVSPKVVTHYKECVEAFENEIKINPNILKNASVRDNLFLIDKAKVMISKTEEDATEMGKWMDRLDNYVKTKTNAKTGKPVYTIVDPGSYRVVLQSKNTANPDRSLERIGFQMRG